MNQPDRIHSRARPVFPGDLARPLRPSDRVLRIAGAHPGLSYVPHAHYRAGYHQRGRPSGGARHP